MYVFFVWSDCMLLTLRTNFSVFVCLSRQKVPHLTRFVIMSVVSWDRSKSCSSKSMPSLMESLAKSSAKVSGNMDIKLNDAPIDDGSTVTYLRLSPN